MMQKKLDAANSKRDAEYREESTKVPVFMMVVVLVLVSAPLVWAISSINTAGSKAADVSKYNTLVQTVGTDLKTVQTMLADGAAGVDIQDRTVTLIVPELVIVDEAKPGDALAPLKIELKGIYWSPTRPLADIDGETYYVGDSIQGYKIIKIGKTAVHFKAKDGRIVVKDFYEDLLQNK